MKIRNFIYLDTEKLYSISSQLFNGFTEELISESREDTTTDETQKINFTSGRTLGHLYTEATRSTEKKFLHDQSFVILENKLIEDNQILKIDQNTNNLSQENLLSKAFVSITAKTRFDDYSALVKLLEDFNDIGSALAYFAYSDQLKIIKTLKDQLKSITDRNEKRKINAIIANSQTLQEYALSKGLNLDTDYKKHLMSVTKYICEDEFCFTQNLNGQSFISFVNRNFLRDKERMLMLKGFVA